MSDTGAITVEPLTPARWTDLVEVFRASAGCDGCWCFNHHIAPDTPDVRGPAARAAKREYVEAGRAHGMIAYRNGEPAGWCAVDRRAAIPGHDCVLSRPALLSDIHAAQSWIIHCFYVRPTFRGQGLARALLAGVLDRLAHHVRAPAVEAFPTPAGRPPCFYGYAGPYHLYREFGFQEVEAIDENYCRMILRF